MDTSSSFIHHIIIIFILKKTNDTVYKNKKIGCIKYNLSKNYWPQFKTKRYTVLIKRILLYAYACNKPHVLLYPLPARLNGVSNACIVIGKLKKVPGDQLVEHDVATG